MSRRDDWRAMADRAVAERVRLARVPYPAGCPESFLDAIAAAATARQIETLIVRLEKFTASGDIVNFRRVSRFRRDFGKLAGALARDAGNVDAALPTEANPIPGQPSDPKI